MALEVVTVSTKPFDGQKPGTSGLRKAVKVFQQENYTENFVSCILRCTGAKDKTLVLGGDGRYFGTECVAIIAKMAAAFGARIQRIWSTGSGQPAVWGSRTAEPAGWRADNHLSQLWDSAGGSQRPSSWSQSSESTTPLTRLQKLGYITEGSNAEVEHLIAGYKFVSRRKTMLKWHRSISASITRCPVWHRFLTPCLASKLKDAAINCTTSVNEALIAKWYEKADCFMLYTFRILFVMKSVQHV